MREAGAAMDGSVAFSVLLKKHLRELIGYHNSCFVPLTGAKRGTQDFVGRYLVAIFSTSGGLPSVHCAGFRIARDLIVTARHCWPLPRAARVKLLSDPQRDLFVLGRAYSPGGKVNDASDFLILRITDPADSFHVDTFDFQTRRRANHVVFVFAVSPLAFEMKSDSNLSQWSKAVYYSRVRSSRLFAPPFREAPGHCLFHRAPTFPGMSGAPIIAVWLDRASNGTRMRFTVIGMHVRDGSMLRRADVRRGNCGLTPEFNIGIELPDAVTSVVQESVNQPR
ncbi:hypothetical protein GOL91_03525 [Sinorhizobium medicae]|nr:hypothetical protein [Sinorhizobium medicae]